MQQQLSNFLSEKLKTQKLCTRIETIKLAFPKITCKQSTDFLVDYYESHSKGLRMLCLVMTQQKNQIVVKKTFYDMFQTEFQQNPKIIKDFKILAIYDKNLQLKQVQPFLKKRKRVVHKIENNKVSQQKKKTNSKSEMKVQQQEIVQLPRVHTKKPLNNNKEFLNTQVKHKPKNTLDSSDQQFDPNKFKQQYFQRQKCVTPSQKKQQKTENIPATAGEPMQIQQDSQERILRQLQRRRLASKKQKELQASKIQKLKSTSLNDFFGKKSSN